MDIIEQYFTLTDSQRTAFTAMAELYARWNAQINVISRKDMDNFYERHVLHSLAIAKMDLIGDGQRVMDLGCGGGFPVVPLAVLYPEVCFTAVDSIGKKIKVVREVCQELGITNVDAINGRVEVVEGDWDWVVSRAVAPLSDLLRWSAGRWSRGMLLLKGGDLEEELSQGKGRYLVEEHRISKIYSGEFFETKSVVVVRR